MLPDATTAFGARVRQRLRDERLTWLTTVGADGTPQPNPVWFLWQEDTPGELLVYNRAGAARLAHLAARPQVALNFNSDAGGGDVVVVTGEARRADELPAPHQLPAYLAKYRDGMTNVSGSPEAFSLAYPVPVRVVIDKVRGF